MRVSLLKEIRFFETVAFEGNQTNRRLISFNVSGLPVSMPNFEQLIVLVSPAESPQTVWSIMEHLLAKCCKVAIGGLIATLQHFSINPAPARLRMDRRGLLKQIRPPGNRFLAAKRLLNGLIGQTSSKKVCSG